MGYYTFRVRDDVLVASDPSGRDVAVIGRGNLSGDTPVGFPLGHTSDATVRAVEREVPMELFVTLPRDP